MLGVGGTASGAACPASHHCGATLRVRVEIIGSQKHGIVGKSQSVLIMINPMIFTRTRTKARSPVEQQLCVPVCALRAELRRAPSPLLQVEEGLSLLTADGDLAPFGGVGHTKL
jgi:hypothetical protein